MNKNLVIPEGPAELGFTGADINGGTWRKLNKYIDAQIDLLRKQNDGDIDALATAKLRGRIVALKALKAAADPAID